MPLPPSSTASAAGKPAAKPRGRVQRAKGKLVRTKPGETEAAPAGVGAPPFWKQKTLETLTPSEWESLCDGCGRCCLVKLEDEDSGEIHYTNIACKLFSAETCQCGDYARRRRRVRDCVKLTPETVRALSWLPRSCAYRLVAEGRDLAWWHPLVSGSASSVHEAGVSVRGRVALLETQVRLAHYVKHIVSWPSENPQPSEQASKISK